jgi:hypothetical protein
MWIDIDSDILGQTVSLLAAPLVLTESSSTPKANLLVPSPIPELLETILLAAVVLARYDILKELFMNQILRNSKAGILFKCFHQGLSERFEQSYILRGAPHAQAVFELQCCPTNIGVPYKLPRVCPNTSQKTPHIHTRIIGNLQVTHPPSLKDIKTQRAILQPFTTLKHPP